MITRRMFLVGSVSAGLVRAAAPRALAAPLQTPQLPLVWIHEFEHPDVLLHFHPKAGQQLTIGLVDEVLNFAHSTPGFDRPVRVRSIELDLHWYSGDVVCNHDDPSSPGSPTLADVLARIASHQGDNGTIHGDGLQFFVVLEPKSDDPRIGPRVNEVLQDYATYVSTAVGDVAPLPRPVTVVVTGNQEPILGPLRTAKSSEGARPDVVPVPEASGDTPDLARFTNHAADRPFRWHNAQAAPLPVPVVDQAHRPELEGARRSVRVYEVHGAFAQALASGADAINADFDQIGDLATAIRSQRPAAVHASLDLSGDRALLVWRGWATNDLLVATGSVGDGGLAFQRQISLTELMPSQPVAVAPTATFMSDDLLAAELPFFIGYEGTAANRLWSTAGTLTSPVRLVHFAGVQNRITLPDDSARRGTRPDVARHPDGRVVLVYTGTAAERLFHVTGRVVDNGLEGDEHSLTAATGARGTAPSIAFAEDGRVVVVYVGTNAERLWYVSGRLEDDGTINGVERPLTGADGAQLTGRNPSVAIGAWDRLVVAFQRVPGGAIPYLSGTLEDDGSIAATEHSLTPGALTAGPVTTAYDGDRVVILYPTESDGRMWYTHGHLDGDRGPLLGTTRLLDMGISNA